MRGAEIVSVILAILAGLCFSFVFVVLWVKAFKWISKSKPGNLFRYLRKEAGIRVLFLFTKELYTEDIKHKVRINEHHRREDLEHSNHLLLTDRNQWRDAWYQSQEKLSKAYDRGFRDGFKKALSKGDDNV